VVAEPCILTVDQRLHTSEQSIGAHALRIRGAGRSDCLVKGGGNGDQVRDGLRGCYGHVVCVRDGNGPCREW
jgi:hypothetical protein